VSKTKMMRLTVILVCLGGVCLSLTSCAARRPTLGPARWQVAAAQPEYLLRGNGPDIPFSQIFERYNGYVLGKEWLEVSGPMRLKIENAYYRQGMPKRGLKGFLGTEIAQYDLGPGERPRLRDKSSNLTGARPPDQPPVTALMKMNRWRHYRFFFALKFKKLGSERSSVLIGGRTPAALDALTKALLTDADAACRKQDGACVIFPEACSVSPQVRVMVNGEEKHFVWGSPLAAVARSPRHLELVRLTASGLVPVELDPSDANALRLPLLPGDRITWQ